MALLVLVPSHKHSTAQKSNTPSPLFLLPTPPSSVQVALLVYKLFGGNISSRAPGDPANMFTYEGPRGIKVRGRPRG
jgi:hypothetical protein